MGTELVSYKQQINTAHQNCIDAKAKGGAYAHECGTWLAKQRDEVPEGQWERWVRANCEFDERSALNYLTIAGMKAQRAADLSQRDCLKEAVDKKTETRILQEFDKKTAELRKERMSHHEKRAGAKSLKDQRDKELADAEARRLATRKKFQETVVSQLAIALKVVEAGYRQAAKELHPDHGGGADAMVNLNFVKERLLTFVKQQWRA